MQRFGNLFFTKFSRIKSLIQKYKLLGIVIGTLMVISVLFQNAGTINMQICAINNTVCSQTGVISVVALSLTAGQTMPLANGVQLNFQSNGTLVVQDTNGNVLQILGTPQNCSDYPCQVIMQSNGTLAMFQNGNQYWSSPTPSSSASFTLQILSGSPYLQIVNSSGSPVWVAGTYAPGGALPTDPGTIVVPPLPPDVCTES
jgi:hypothetical protein